MTGEMPECVRPAACCRAGLFVEYRRETHGRLGTLASLGGASGLLGKGSRRAMSLGRGALSHER